MYKAYKDDPRVEIILVYISEAHPVRKSSNPDKPSSPKDITRAKNAKERVIAADACMKGLKFTMPILIDLPPEGQDRSMVGVVERAYRGKPAATVIVDLEGKIAFYSRGSRGVQPKKADEVIKSLIAKGGFPARNPNRWEKNIRRFEARDKTNPPPKGKILFLGSSSIVRWNTDRLFPDHTTINRGFGGSQISDSLEFADRILLPYRPRTIVFYAGDNDIAAGESPQQILGDYKALVAKVRSELPKTRIIFVAIKPSTSRWKLWPKMKQANEAVAEFCKSEASLEYLDIAAPMLGADGKPKKELLASDGLHLSEAGYELWTSLALKLLGQADK